MNKHIFKIPGSCFLVANVSKNYRKRAYNATDEMDTVNYGYGELQTQFRYCKAGVSAEYHISAEGGHAFGLNESAQKVPGWESYAP